MKHTKKTKFGNDHNLPFRKGERAPVILNEAASQIINDLHLSVKSINLFL